MRYLIFLICALLLTGCDEIKITGSIITIDELIDELPEEDGEIEAFFCPVDNCSERLIGLIMDSGSVDCAFFDLDIPELIDALESRQARVVIDNTNQEELEEAGHLSFVRYDDGNRLSHNKFCIFDEKVVWTGSFNPTYNGDQKNNNNVVVIRSKYLAKEFQDEFEELWRGEFGKGSRTHNYKVLLNGLLTETYFCPDDCKTFGGESRLVELIDGANESIEMAIFSFTLDSVGDALIRAKQRGIKVTVMIESRQRNVKGSEYGRLKEAGIDILIDNNKAMMHHKFVIIDGKIVWTGSYNFSRNANNRNDENIVVLRDPEVVKRFQEEFSSIMGDTLQ